MCEKNSSNIQKHTLIMRKKIKEKKINKKKKNIISKKLIAIKKKRFLKIAKNKQKNKKTSVAKTRKIKIRNIVKNIKKMVTPQKVEQSFLIMNEKALPSISLPCARDVINESILPSDEEIIDVFAKAQKTIIENNLDLICVMPPYDFDGSFCYEQKITFLEEDGIVHEIHSIIESYNDNFSQIIPETDDEEVEVPKASQLNKIQDLTFVRSASIVLWPLLKIYNSIYWFFKINIVKRKKRKYVIQYLETIEKEKQEMDVFAKPDRIELWGLVIPHNWKRVLVSFVVVGLFLILPFEGLDYYESISGVKEKMLAKSRIALASLEDGQVSIKNLDLRAAAEDFEIAKNNFEYAKLEFSKMNVFTRVLATKFPKKGKNVQTSLNLLDVGKSIAEAGQNLSLSVNSLLEDFKINKNITSKTLDKLSILRGSLDLVLPKIAEAKDDINSIDLDTLNDSNKNAVSAVRRTLPDIEMKIQNLSLLTETVLHVLGHDYWQRYLVLFQNSNEMRATGGFLGSFALMDINKGKIVNLEIPSGGTYDLQGSLRAMVESPQPLHIINPIWEFQDSNWWPNFPDTAKKASWFYEKSAGASVHGVIAITSNFMEDILKVIGPIEMQKYERTITSENFVDETQKIIEIEYDKIENKPKQFIADMAPEIIDAIALLEHDKLQELIDATYKGLSEKQILLYSYNSEIQKIIEDLDWAGSQNNDKGDYLSVINTNIAGNKTDGMIREEITHTVNIDTDGIITDTVKIIRSHDGIKGEQFTGVQNNNYIRIYVPLGSKLISAVGFAGPDANLFEIAPEGYKIDEDVKRIEGNHTVDALSGMEIYNENNKTVFANWIMLKPGESKTTIIQYTLPHTLSDDNTLYNLNVQKQPGSSGSGYTLEFYFPKNMSIVETYPKNLSAFAENITNNIIQYSDTLSTDKFYGIVIK